MRSALLVWLIGGLLLLVPDSQAQGLGRFFEGFLASPDKAASTHEPCAADQLDWVRGKLTEIESQVATLQDPAFSQKLHIAGWPPERAEEFLSLLRRQEESWRNSQTMLEQIVIWESIKDPAESTPPPASEEEAALLTSRLRAEQARAARAAQMIEGNVRLTATSRQDEREARQNVLLAEEKIQSLPENADPAAREAAALELTLAQLRLGLQEARLFYLLWNTYSLQLEQKQASQRSQGIARALDRTGFSRLLQADRLQARLDALAREIPEMQSQAAAAEELYQQATAELKSLQQATEQAATDKSPKLPSLRQSLLARLEQNRRLEGVKAIQNHLIELASIERELASQVLQALQSRHLRDFEKARRLLTEQRDEIQLSRPRLESRLAEVDSTLEALQNELANSSLPKSRRAELEKVVAATNREKEVLGLLFQRLVALSATTEQLITELTDAIRHEDWSARAIARGESLLTHLANAWNFPLFVSGGTMLTLGKLLSALLALAVALFLSRLLARQLGRSVTSKFRLPESQAHVITTLLTYLLSIILVLTTLQFLHIPLTVFAFLGGALMVGIGFGSQNLMNNFISGLILLLERKLNVGDLVEADGHFGRITHLGSRCSSIRKPDGVEILVPNSFFLEKNVANWTLSDPDHRFDFTVGLAYGTPVEKALTVLEQAVREDPEVLSSPAPLVVFESFGDSALIFRIFFWLRVSESDGRIVGSRIRTRIDRLCRENQFSIPFPQRDINLRLPQGASAPGFPPPQPNSSEKK